MTERKDLELKQCKQTITTLKRDFDKERQQWQKEDELKHQHIKKLKDMVHKTEENKEAQDDTFEDILREEMRVMKAAFELKMTHLREELAQKSISCSREVRLLKEELDAERRQSASFQAKLKSIEDSKK